MSVSIAKREAGGSGSRGEGHTDPYIRDVLIDPDGNVLESQVKAFRQRLGVPSERKPLLLGKRREEWVQLTRQALFAGESTGETSDGAMTPQPMAVIATGHQAGFWHAGIAAKYFALDALSNRFDSAARLEVVVDQDVNVDVRVLRVPAVTAQDEAGAISIPWSEGVTDSSQTERATGWQPPIAMDPDQFMRRCDGILERAGLRWATDEIRAGVERMAKALEQHREDAHSAAAQFAQACAEICGRSSADRHGELRRIFASRLREMEFVRAMIEEMAQEPARMHAAYNEAVRSHPHAGIAVLGQDHQTGELEMPFWVIDENGTRRSAFERDLKMAAIAADEKHTLAPKALTLTAIMRLVMCDAFIHGTGGGRYDAITEQWIRNWLEVELAPLVVISATMWLDFGREVVSAAQLNHLKWLTHSLQYSLDRDLGDTDPQWWNQRKEILANIASAPRRSAQRRELFEQMRRLQKKVRDDHPQRLAQVDQQVAAAEAQQASGAVFTDRTWSIGLMPVEQVAALKQAVARLCH